MSISSAPLLILDAHTSAGLACIRSLGKQSLEIHAASYRKSAHGLYSRFVRRRYVYPNPEHHIDSFIQWLRQQLNRYHYQMVWPMTEATLLAIARHRDQLPPSASLAIPSEKAIHYTFHKQNTLDLARNCGISGPQSFLITAPSMLDPLSLRFPVVLKEPRTGTIHEGRVRSGRGVFYLNTPEALKKKVQEGNGKEFLVQELLLGTGAGISLIHTPQGMIAPFAHRRLVEAHPTGSRSVLAERLPLKKDLLPKIERFLQQAEFYGPVMFEFKECDSEWFLLEVNGRFWGSLPLPISCGIDFPLLFYHYLTGVSETTVRTTTFKQVHYLLGYAEHLLRTLRGKPVEWPGTFPTRREALCGFLHTCFSGHPDFSFQSTDLFPGWIEIGDRIGYGVQKWFKR